MGTIASLESVSYSYDGINNVLKSVSLKFEKGRIYALVGPNGAGKTTLVRVLSGDLEPSSGRAMILGKSSKADRKKSSSCVQQQLSLFENLTVTENLIIATWRSIFNFKPTILTGSDYAIKQLEQIDESIKLDALCGKLPFANRQKVEIARALSYSPIILFLDEATSALSSADRLKLFGVIHKIVERGITVVVVTHNPSDIDMLNAITINMEEGEILPKNPKAPSVPENTPADRNNFLQVDSSSITIVKSINNINKNNFKFSLLPGDCNIVSFTSSHVRTAYVDGWINKNSEWKIILHENKNKKDINLPSPSYRKLVRILTMDRFRDYVFPLLSVLDNVILLSKRLNLLNLRKQSEELKILAELKRISDVSFPREDSMLKNLSGGNIQRLAVASFAIFKPYIMLIEEPMSGIDKDSINKILFILKKYQSQGGKLVIATCFPGLYQSLHHKELKIE